MESESERESADVDEVPMLPAAAVGFLMYPWALELIRAHPPANDLGAVAGRR